MFLFGLALHFRIYWMKISVFATYEQMHGRKSTIAELAERLKPFSRESVLYTCSVRGMVLRLWQGADWDRANHDLLLTACFDPLRGDWYKLSARTEDPELVFHRRQLLLIMKLAIEHCPPVGADLLGATPHHLGTILLMANDQFHFGLPAGKHSDGEEPEKVSRLLAEFVPVNEYGSSRIENLITATPDFNRCTFGDPSEIGCSRLALSPRVHEFAALTACPKCESLCPSFQSP